MAIDSEGTKPLFPWIGKKHVLLLIKTTGLRRKEGGKTNKYIETRRSEAGSPVPLIYYIFCQSDYWKAISSSGRALEKYTYSLPSAYSIFPCPLQIYSLPKEVYLQRQAQSSIQTQCNCNSSLVFVIIFQEKKSFHYGCTQKSKTCNMNEDTAH